MFAVLCPRVSVVYSTWLRECSFSLTICRQDLPAFNSRLNLLDQSSFLSWPIWSVNAIPESLFWCSGSQNFSQYLMALHFVFVRIGKRSTSDLHAFELQNLLTPNSYLMNFVWKNSFGSFSSFPSWSTPQTSLPYVSIGEITVSKMFIVSCTSSLKWSPISFRSLYKALRATFFISCLAVN